MALKINNPKYGNVFVVSDTFDELRLVSTTKVQDGYSAIVNGDSAPGDGLGGLFVWNATSTEEDDSEKTIAPDDGQVGRWIKVAVGQRGPVGPQGAAVVGPKGDPGSNVSDIGTFAQARAQTIIASATTIRLSDRNKAVFERDTSAFGDLAALYAGGENIWWFKDAAASKWIMAGQQIDIMAGGAVNSKTADNGAIIQACLDFGSLSKRNVFVPAGAFGYARPLIVKGATGLVGVPGVSILYCTTRDTGALIMEGNGGTLYGISRLHYLPRPIGINDRNGDDLADGIYARGATNFTIQFCRTEGPQGGSLMLRGCQNGRITNNWFESSLADSIHITAAGKGDAPIYNPDGSFKETNQIPVPAYRLHIADNIVNNSGDDNIAIVSYVSHSLTELKTIAAKTYVGYFTEYVEDATYRNYSGNNRSINIVGNSTYGGDARGITVVGGRDINITSNYIEDSVVAGILAYGEESYQTYGCDNVNITGNTLVNTGNGGAYRPVRFDAYGNQMKDRANNLGLVRNLDSISNPSVIISGRSSTFPSQNISFRSNMLTGIRQRGILVDHDVINADISENSFRNAVGVAIFANAGSNIRIQNNRVIDTTEGAIGLNIGSCAGHIIVKGNQLHNVNTGGSAGTDAIHFEGQPSASVLSTTISDNRISGPQTYERFVEAFFDNVVAENNIGAGDVGLGSTPNSVRQRLKGTNVSVITSAAIPPNAAPTALTDTVTRADFTTNAGVTNTTKDKLNTLINVLVTAGLIKQP